MKKNLKLSLLLLCATLIFGGVLACDLGGAEQPTPAGKASVALQSVEATPTPSLVTLSDGSQVPLPGDAELVPVVEGFYMGFTTGLIEPQLFDFYAAWLSQRGWVFVSPIEAVVSKPHQRWRKGDLELLIELQSPDERGRTVAWLQVSSLTPPSLTVPTENLTALATPTAVPQPATPTPQPSPTPWSPVPPTAVPPIPTVWIPPQPTSPAGVPVTGRYAQVWERWGGAGGLLGKALAPAVEGFYSGQHFERGLMHWGRLDTIGEPDREIQVIVYGEGGDSKNGDSWWRLEDDWKEGDAEYSCPEAQPPLGPRRGFGLVWCEYKELRDAIGAPLEAEWGEQGGYQDFEGGTLLWVPRDGGIYVLLNRGDWHFELVQ